VPKKVVGVKSSVVEEETLVQILGSLYRAGFCILGLT
jgi:hypothetical protein